MVKSLFTTLCTLFVLALTASAQPASYITNYSEFGTWLPIILLAILVSILITSLYYVAGVFMNNRKVKSNAVTELEQAVGTGIVTILIIGIFVLIGSGQLSLVPLLSPNSANTVCSQLSSSSFTFLSSKYSFTNSSGVSIPTTANAVCSGVNAILTHSTGSDITPMIDYGLFYSYIIVDNLTNQAAKNLNAFYVFTGWIGFLSMFRSYSEVCWPADCAIPGVEATASIAYSYQPYAGYNMITSMIKSTQLEAGLTFYIMVMQLLVITFLLFAWPYMLAAGIILRSSFFTRKTGGLLMAMSLVAVLIFPILYGMEYTANTLTITTSTTSTSTSSTSTTSITTTSTSTKSTTSTSTKTTTSTSTTMSTTSTSTSTSTTSLIYCPAGGGSVIKCVSLPAVCSGCDHPFSTVCHNAACGASCTAVQPCDCPVATPYQIACLLTNCTSGSFTGFSPTCMGSQRAYDCKTGTALSCGTGGGCLPAGCVSAWPQTK
jgi:hypothetical protein